MNKLKATSWVAALLVIGLVLWWVMPDSAKAPDSAATVDSSDAGTIGEAAIESPTEIADAKIDGDLNENTVGIAFPDGDVITVNMRKIKRPKFVVPQDLALAYGSLRQKAESGDAQAAFVLGAMLKDCRTAMRNEEKLDAYIEKMYQTPIEDMHHGDPKIVKDLADPRDMVEKQIRAKFASCNEVTDEQKGEAESWTELAAQGGHELARLRYAAQNTTSELGVELHLELWNDGYVEALSRLANYYRGVFEEEYVAPDRIKAFAYRYLAGQFELASLAHQFGVEIPASWRRASEEGARRLGSSLSPFELEQAIELAKKMLRENENCCVSH